MKIDLLLIPVGARYAEMRAAALAAEAAGFDGLWTWDHLRDPDERAEAGVDGALVCLGAKLGERRGAAGKWCLAVRVVDHVAPGSS